MTPHEVQAALKSLAHEMGGPRSTITTFISTELGTAEKPICASVSPRGGLAGCFSVYGATWPGLIAAIREKWTQVAGDYAANTLRAMALAIIRITAERGECSDAALRMEFDAEEVAKFADEACRDAETIGKGPFVVTRTDGANAVAA